MKKHLPLIFAVLLGMYGLSAFPTSIIAGALGVLAAVVLVPQAVAIVVAKFPKATVLSNKYLCYGLAVGLLVLSSMAMTSAKNSAIVSDFEQNKQQIVQEINGLIDQKDFIKAKVSIEKYLKVMPQNTDLIALQDKEKEAVAKDKQEKIEAENQRKAAEAREQQEASARAAANKTVALSYFCGSSTDVQQEAMAARQYQDSGQLTAALNMIKSTPGCGMSSLNTTIPKSEWQLFVDGNHFVLLRAKDPQKYGYQYMYGITTKDAYQNPM